MKKWISMLLSIFLSLAIAAAAAGSRFSMQSIAPVNLGIRHPG
jgi:Skp family chaperone for outer membrane proteins